MGIPRLVFSTTSTFTEKWRDKGSGASMDGAFYTTVPPENFFSIGDYGQDNYKEPAGTVIVVQAVDDDPKNPLLAAPAGFRQIVNDRRSGADQDGSFWLPLAPPGYISIGSVVQSGYDPPSGDTGYRCLRYDQVVASSIGGLIYADHNSGATEDMAIYWLANTNVIFAKEGYAPPTQTVWQPKELALGR